MPNRLLPLFVIASLVLSGTCALAAGPAGGSTQPGEQTIKIEPLDLAIILVYLVGIVALGCWAGMRRKEAKGSDYFLAGKSLTWPIIGLALFATNISTIHLVSFAQNGFTSGLTYGNFEWMAAFTLVILAWFFAPFYIRSGVATLPDFMERRFSRGSRDYLALLSIFSAIVVHIGFSLYTGTIVIEGSVLRAFMDHPEHYRLWTVLGICGATAIYTIVGGLLAVVVTESIQTVVLLVGAVFITLLGLHMMGEGGQPSGGLLGLGQMAEGWSRVKQNVHPGSFSILRPDSDPSGISWYAVLLGYPVLGIWYWCTDQTIVQRVLGAKNENHARVGPLFAGFIKILPVFLFVLPGIICLALVNTGKIPGLPTLADGSPDTEKTYSHLIANVLPLGVRGIVVAALLAALMSTVSGALNSIATLFSYDIYKRFKPEADDRHLIRIGRLATFVAMCVAVAWTMAIGGQKSIFQMMVDVFPVVAPPTAVVFVWGVFWKRASATASLVTLIGGSVVGLVLFVLNIQGLNKIGDYEINALMQAFILFVLESVGLVILSFLFPHKHTAESEKLVWKSPLEALRGGTTWRGLGDYRVLSVVLIVTMVGMYVWFRGQDTYYSVDGQITLADPQEALAGGTPAGTPVAGAEVFFDCPEDETFSFSRFTDADGRYQCATKHLVAGAPAGTEYRVRIVPRMNLIVEMKEVEEEKDGKPVKTLKADKVLYKVPIGTPIEEGTLTKDVDLEEGWKTRAHKDVYTFTLKTTDRHGKPVEKVVHVPRGENVKIVQATDVPEQYRQFGTSGLSCTVRAVPMFTTKRQTYDFRLEPDTPGAR